MEGTSIDDAQATLVLAAGDASRSCRIAAMELIGLNRLRGSRESRVCFVLFC